MYHLANKTCRSSILITDICRDKKVRALDGTGIGPSHELTQPPTYTGL